MFTLLKGPKNVKTAFANSYSSEPASWKLKEQGLKKKTLTENTRYVQNLMASFIGNTCNKEAPRCCKMTHLLLSV